MADRKSHRRQKGRFLWPAAAVAVLLVGGAAFPGPADEENLDAKVKIFLDKQRDQWRDENVTAADGRFLYDFVRAHQYKRALEIGTSTGHSGIWIAWALSQTGGRLITIEISETRHEKALKNFQAAGLSGFIDARLADAHELVPLLEGPFDFVFLDADKEWYLNYFKMLLPKLEKGGCVAAHNVVNLEFMHGVKDFLDYTRSLSEIETSIEHISGSGISLSIKKKIL